MAGKLTRPWSIQVELAEGCNRLCPFCGLNGIRDGAGNYKYMTVETAKLLAKQCSEFCPNARYEFAMHGEPTMNPKANEIFEIFRRKLPDAQMQLTTNGKVMLKNVEWMQKKIDAIFVSGIDFIILDTYWPERDQIREMITHITGHDVIDFYEDMAPNNESPWYNHHRKFNNTIVLMDDLLKRNGEVKSRTIYNHAGNADPKIAPPVETPLKKTCTMPFREMAIRWDGNIALCCHDWKGEYMISNIHDKHMKDIWMDERFEAARTFLQNKQRTFNPCSRCNIDSGSRAGLLPKYPAPTQETALIVLDTISESKEATGFPLKITKSFAKLIED